MQREDERLLREVLARIKWLDSRLAQYKQTPIEDNLRLRYKGKVYFCRQEDLGVALRYDDYLATLDNIRDTLGVYGDEIPTIAGTLSYDPLPSHIKDGLYGFIETLDCIRAQIVLSAPHIAEVYL